MPRTTVMMLLLKTTQIAFEEIVFAKGYVRVDVFSNKFVTWFVAIDLSFKRLVAVLTFFLKQLSNPVIVSDTTLILLHRPNKRSKTHIRSGR